MARGEMIKQFEQFQQDVVLETSDHALSTLTSMVVSGSIDLSPQFQRRDRWDTFKQSQLIESFILNIPVPPIYLAEGRRGRYDVIDGKQRLTAISQFLSGSFALRGIDRFPAIRSARFSDLPAEIQSTLNFRPLRTVTLLRQSSDDAKYEVFHRLNTGGQILNAQEIRNVLFRGPLNELIYELSEHKFLRKQLKITSDRAAAYKKMTDAEWVLRYLSLLTSWSDFTGDLRQTMDDFMAQHQDASENRLKTFATSFQNSIKACEDIFGANAFKRPDKGGWRDQAIAGLYDAEMIAIAELSPRDVSSAIKRRETVVKTLRDLFQKDEEFEEAVRQGTNTPSRVRYRIEALRNTIQSISR